MNRKYIVEIKDLEESDINIVNDVGLGILVEDWLDGFRNCTVKYAEVIVTKIHE